MKQPLKLDRKAIIIIILALILLMALFTSFIYFFFTNNSQDDYDIKNPNTNVEILKRDRDMENADPGQGNN